MGRAHHRAGVPTKLGRRCVTARHDIETLVGLDEYYAIEEETVEERENGVSGDPNPG